MLQGCTAGGDHGHRGARAALNCETSSPLTLLLVAGGTGQPRHCEQGREPAVVHRREPEREWVSCLGAGGAAGQGHWGTLYLGQQQGEVSKGQLWLSTAMEHRGSLGGGDKTGQGGTCHVSFLLVGVGS